MERKDYEQLLMKRKQLAGRVHELADKSGELLAPLRSLTEEQATVVAILGYLWQISALARRPQFAIDKNILRRFQDQFITICPQLPPDFVMGDPCFNAMVDYGVALAKCEGENRTEEECHESWGPLHDSLACAMAKIEELGERLKEMVQPGGEEPWPPPPPPPIS